MRIIVAFEHEAYATECLARSAAQTFTFFEHGSILTLPVKLSNPQEEGRGPVFERHFSPEDLAELWGLSGDTIRRLFETEPGVLVIERGSKTKARRYRTMRIPESVALRVHRRSTNPIAMLNR